jgi:hypothetical protein
MLPQIPNVMNNPEIEFKVELVPVIRKDVRTGQFVAHFEIFPRAMAVGHTPDEAKNELLSIFSLMASERPGDIKKVIVEKYYEKRPTTHQVLKDVKVLA